MKRTEKTSSIKNDFFEVKILLRMILMRNFVK